MKAIPDLKTIGNPFKFPSFRHRVKGLLELNARKYNVADLTFSFPVFLPVQPSNIYVKICTQISKFKFYLV